MPAKRKPQPTLEQFKNFSISTQYNYRKLYPNEFPKPDYVKKDVIPTLEQYNSKCKQYQYYLRKRHPNVFPEARAWGTNREEKTLLKVL